ncbi:MAG: 23S rRNA pseudouridine(1911/1915/1917) synthase RluD [Acinetobacter sp.]|nr:23S rRNA pseudouridine(1911/1915/1917) synthase RluD [Acinetobacter sp.]
MSVTLSNVAQSSSSQSTVTEDDELLITTNNENHTQFLLEHQLDETHFGARIDQVVAEIWSDFSREKLKQWIKDGKLLVDGQQVKPKYQCKGVETVRLDVVLQQQNHYQAEDIPLSIIYEDDDIMVINKAVGMVVHPGAGNPSGTLLNALLHYYPKSAELDRAGLVHRIDKDTSGLLVVAKTLEAQFALSQQLAEKSVYRLYDLIVYGYIIAGGTIDKPIKRHPHDRVKMAVLAGGKDAITHYNVKERFKHFTRLHAQLETGRTHQIRVHFSYLGHPLIGDPVYLQRVKIPAGASPALKEILHGFKRQALHAYQLGLIHPRTGQQMTFEAPLPDDFQHLLNVLRQENPAD